MKLKKPPSPAKLKKLDAWHAEQRKANGIFIPVKTPNPLNGTHGHWRVKSRIRKTIRTATSAACRGLILFEEPLLITITRYSPGILDAWDGLPAALKPVIDGVADSLGIKDHDPRVKWKVDQVRSPGHGVRINAVTQL